jgi:N-acetylglucosamine kinase-like BadF-type ATPase
MGNTPPEDVVVSAGLAALDGPADADILGAFRARLPGGCTLHLTSDALIALMGHTMGGPGMMVICGTGSMLMALDRSGKEHVLGGWGWKMGDAGSGYTLSRNALVRATEDFDLTGHRSVLMEEALRFFAAAQPRDLIARLYDPAMGTDTMAAFGARVLEAARQGDADALHIAEHEMTRLACLAEALYRQVPEAAVCAVYGGVMQHSPLARQLFTQALSERCSGVAVTAPRHPPEIGAVVLGMLKDGKTAEEISGLLERRNGI